MHIGLRFQKLLSSINIRRNAVQGRERGHSRFVPTLETALGIAIILGAGVVLPGQGWELLDLQPHPLWIIVLAIAVRYGGWNGYLAGGLCAAVYAFLLWARPESRFQPLISHDLIQPFLMFVVGAVLGEIAHARERRLADLESRLAETVSASQTLWERYKAIEQTQTELEKQIAFESNSIATLAILGKRLQSLNLGDLHNAIVDVLPTMLEIETCSVYVCQDGLLLLEAGAGKVDVRDPLVGRVMRERRVLTIRDQILQNGIASANDTQVFMAGPLILSDGRIYGLVLIDSVPFAAITPSNLVRFDMILNWASAALDNALLYQDSRLVFMEENMQETEISWMLTPGVRDK